MIHSSSVSRCTHCLTLTFPLNISVQSYPQLVAMGTGDSKVKYVDLKQFTLPSLAKILGLDDDSSVLRELEPEPAIKVTPKKLGVKHSSEEDEDKPEKDNDINESKDDIDEDESEHSKEEDGGDENESSPGDEDAINGSDGGDEVADSEEEKDESQGTNANGDNEAFHDSPSAPDDEDNDDDVVVEE